MKKYLLAFSVLILLACSRSVVNQPLDPWTSGGTTYKIHHFHAVADTTPHSMARVFHGKVNGQEKPFLWAYAARHVVSFQVMTGAVIPIPPVVLEFWRSYGRP